MNSPRPIGKLPIEYLVKNYSEVLNKKKYKEDLFTTRQDSKTQMTTVEIWHNEEKMNKSLLKHGISSMFMVVCLPFG